MTWSGAFGSTGSDIARDENGVERAYTETRTSKDTAMVETTRRSQTELNSLGQETGFEEITKKTSTDPDRPIDLETTTTRKGATYDSLGRLNTYTDQSRDQSGLQRTVRQTGAEYNLLGGGVVYFYQAGIDPDQLAEQPGHVLTAARMERVIQRGYQAVDFLRGDEPYKAHLGAEPRALMSLRIVRRLPAAQLRHQMWQLNRDARRLARQRPYQEPRTENRAIR